MRTDSIHVSISAPVYPILTHNPIQSVNMTSFAENKYLSELTYSSHFGYAFPLGSNFGIRIDTMISGLYDRPWEDQYTTDYTNSRDFFGAILDIGYAVTNRWALGFGIGLFTRADGGDGLAEIFMFWNNEVVFSGNLGFLYRNTDESLFFDSRIGFNNDTYDILDTNTLQVAKETSSPLFLESTITLSFNDNNTFLIIKQINNISYDRPYYYGTLLPAMEHFLSEKLSFRGGVEGSVSMLNVSTGCGYGLLAGITSRNSTKGFDLDLNFTFRMRPSRAVENLLYPDFLFLLNLTWNDVYISREK